MEIQIETIGLKETQEAFKRIMTDSPGMDKRIKSVIRKILSELRKEVSADAADGLGMQGDPRKAYRAVKMSVYKRIFGGNVSLLQRKRPGAPNNYVPARADRTGLRGGNRWGRSERTKEITGWGPADRGMILRILNQGVKKDRFIKSYTDKKGEKHGLRSGTGRRGQIEAANWFDNFTRAGYVRVSMQLDQLINDVINEEFK